MLVALFIVFSCCACQVYKIQYFYSFQTLSKIFITDKKSPTEIYHQKNTINEKKNRWIFFPLQSRFQALGNLVALFFGARNIKFIIYLTWLRVYISLSIYHWLFTFDFNKYMTKKKQFCLFFHWRHALSTQLHNVSGYIKLYLRNLLNQFQNCHISCESIKLKMTFNWSSEWQKF